MGHVYTCNMCVQDSVTNLHNAKLVFTDYQPNSSAPDVNSVEQCTCPAEYTVKRCHCCTLYLSPVFYSSQFIPFFRCNLFCVVCKPLFIALEAMIVIIFIIIISHY